MKNEYFQIRKMQSPNSQVFSANVSQLMEVKKLEIEKMTKEIVDTEMGLFELEMCASSLGKKHINKINKDVNDFKKTMFNKAKKLSEKSGKTPLEEYKKSINYI